ncbi:MAG: hypothetical protein GEU73_10690 [Chloroflexi bacterium]|nr:hypothetical protein [Chloroflexota bacterium]
MPRLLTRTDVEDLLDFGEAMACLEHAFEDQARGEISPWPPSLMRNGPGAPLILRSGGLAAQGRMGVRVSTGPGNPSYALLHESPSGALLALMEYPFSELRLAAAVAVGVARLARPDARHIAMIGTGRNALGLLKAVARVRPIASVKVYSRQDENRVRFAAASASALDVAVIPVPSPEEAVAGAEIVVVATNSRTPALRGAWLPPDVLVTSIGVRTELDEEVYLRAKLIVTTSKIQELNIHEVTDDLPLVRLTRSGALDWESVAELGEVVSGHVSRPGGLVVFREAQGGFTDIAIAARAYDRAIALGRGTEWRGH